ncbi:hypothetical protein EDD21DRAFT_112028 [Dissophora ornata]|nr:hypothetical protein EDD21DRAFT_112028 [Dissophora ornata]
MLVISKQLMWALDKRRRKEHVSFGNFVSSLDLDRYEKIGTNKSTQKLLGSKLHYLDLSDDIGISRGGQFFRFYFNPSLDSRCSDYQWTARLTLHLAVSCAWGCRFRLWPLRLRCLLIILAIVIVILFNAICVASTTRVHKLQTRFPADRGLQSAIVLVQSAVSRLCYIIGLFCVSGSANSSMSIDRQKASTVL